MRGPVSFNIEMIKYGSAALSSCTKLADTPMLLKTKPPLWNEEHQTFMHNFGCRVRKATNRNFIVIADNTLAKPRVKEYQEVTSGCIFLPDCLPLAARKEATRSTTKSALSGSRPVATPPHMRHGAISDTEYILDFREPITPIIALATLCAVHANKPLVRM